MKKAKVAKIFWASLALGGISLALASPSSWAYNQDDLQRLLETKNCPQCDLRFAILEEVNLDDAQLAGANFEGAKLLEVSLQHAELQNTNFNYALIHDSDLNFARLEGADLQHATLEDSNLTQANLTQANLNSVNIHNSDLQGAKLNNVTMREAQWVGVGAEGMEAQGADFTRTKLLGAAVPRSDFTLATLNESRWVVVNAFAANFSSAKMLDFYAGSGNFYRADFTRADLKNATLHNAFFRQSQLVNTNLQNADLQSLNLQEANLENANLTGFTCNNLILENVTWIDGSKQVPLEFFAEHGSQETKNWLIDLIENNSEELLLILLTFLPDNNMVTFPAILLMVLGVVGVSYLNRVRSLLFYVSLLLFDVGLTLLLFTKAMIDILQVGFLWEVLLMATLTFIFGAVCGFLEALFGGGFRKILRVLWGAHAVVTLVFIALSIILYQTPYSSMLPWLKVVQAGVMLLFVLAYLLIPFFTVAQGVIYGNTDARIVAGTFLAGIVLSLPLLFMFEKTWTKQLSILGGMLFALSPAMILFRRSIAMQNRLECYAAELEYQSEDLELKNEELSRLNQLKDEFLANTTHELKTPLNGMIGITESMLDGAAGSLTNSQKQHLGMISTSSRRLSHLVNDLLDFSQLKHKNLDLRKKAVDLHSMCELVLTLSKPLLGDRPLKLFNEIPADLPPVLADEDRLQQIFHNLVGNAIKFTPQGKIVVSAQMQEGFIEVSVADTGIGIPAEKTERIFESFEQADGSTARKYGGTGLGLAITKQLVELHGGTIGVTSQPEEGSTFFFTLPLAPGDVAQTDVQLISQTLQNLPEAILEPIAQSNILVSQAVSHEGAVSPETSVVAAEKDSRFHILAVDDDPINLQVLVNHLSLQNYQVTLANDGLEAIDLLENGHSFDLVLLDVMMPKMTGYELCQQIRESYPAHHLPVLLLTAKNQVSELITGFNVGANDYLTKPISKNELLPRIRTHLQLSKINRAYSRFVPSEFLDLLQKENIVDVQLGDHVKQEMSILFCDIRSFTTISESLTPEATFRFINSYLSYMEPAILDHGGVIDKYIGDAVMALFAHPHQAIDAGMALLENLALYNQERTRAGEIPIEVGIGINTGNLMLGTIGGEKRMDSTVISDSVNLAARMEGLTKIYKTPLLVSERTYAGLDSTEKYNTRFIDHAQVKGKQEVVAVYEIFNLDPAPLRDAKLFVQETYQEAIQAYQQEDWNQAQSLFETCLETLPEDEVLKIYLQRCREHVG